MYLIVALLIFWRKIIFDKVGSNTIKPDYIVHVTVHILQSIVISSCIMNPLLTEARQYNFE